MIKRLNFFSPKGIFFLCLFPLFAKPFIRQILIESRNVRFGFCQVFIEGVIVGK